MRSKGGEVEIKKLEPLKDDSEMPSSKMKTLLYGHGDLRLQGPITKE
jgi:hypothetical protein